MVFRVMPPVHGLRFAFLSLILMVEYLLTYYSLAYP